MGYHKKIKIKCKLCGKTAKDKGEKTMKKLFAIILSVAMLLSFAACGGNETATTTAPETTAQSTEAPADPDMNQPAAPGEGPEMPAVDTPAVDGEGAVSDGTSAGQTLLNVFYDELAGNPEATGEELANAIMAHESIQFMPMVAPVEEGFLNGFDNYEVKGFENGYFFGPGMSSIAFAGYIFELADGADVEAFKDELKANANLRWMVCAEAEEMICENVGNTVFFLMCPTSIA